MEASPGDSTLNLNIRLARLHQNEIVHTDVQGANERRGHWSSF
jgi:hypothetical protein